LLVALIGLLALPVLAQEATETPSAEPSLSLGRLSVGEPVESGLSLGAGAQLFFFVGMEGDSVTITMERVGNTQLDPFLMVLGRSGEILAVNDDMGPGTLNAQVADLVLPADGPYVVLATTFDGVRGNSLNLVEEPWGFTLTLEGSTVPEMMDESALALRGSELTYGAPFNGAIIPEEPIYYFFFNGEEGDVIDISLTSDNFDTLLYLFNGSGGFRLAVNDDGGQNSNSALTGVELPETARYMVFVTYYGFTAFDPDEEWQAGNGRFTILVDKKN
jgi:hypothetical protein